MLCCILLILLFNFILVLGVCQYFMPFVVFILNHIYILCQHLKTVSFYVFFFFFRTLHFFSFKGPEKNVKANYFAPTPDITFNSNIIEKLDPNTTYYIFLKSFGKHMGGSTPTYTVSTPPLGKKSNYSILHSFLCGCACTCKTPKLF